MVDGDAWLGETPAAWMRPVTSPSAVAVWRSACTDLRDDTSTVAVLTSKSRIAQYLGRRVCVLLAQVSQHDVLARTHPPRDRLANRPRSNDNDHIAHGDALS